MTTKPPVCHTQSIIRSSSAHHHTFTHEKLNTVAPSHPHSLFTAATHGIVLNGATDTSSLATEDVKHIWESVRSTGYYTSSNDQLKAPPLLRLGLLELHKQLQESTPSVILGGAFQTDLKEQVDSVRGATVRRLYSDVCNLIINHFAPILRKFESSLEGSAHRAELMHLKILETIARAKGCVEPQALHADDEGFTQLVIGVLLTDGFHTEFAVEKNLPTDKQFEWGKVRHGKNGVMLSPLHPTTSEFGEQDDFCVFSASMVHRGPGLGFTGGFRTDKSGLKKRRVWAFLNFSTKPVAEARPEDQLTPWQVASDRTSFASPTHLAALKHHRDVLGVDATKHYDHAAKTQLRSALQYPTPPFICDCNQTSCQVSATDRQKRHRG